MLVQFDPTNEAERAKVRALLDLYEDQGGPPLTPADLFQGLARRNGQPAETESNPESRFARFWSVVHAKIKRAKAEPAFHKAVDLVAAHGDCSLDEAAEFITDRMKAYAASPAGNPTDRSPTHPATWLNGAQYEDDPATWQQENGTQPQRRLAL